MVKSGLVLRAGFTEKSYSLVHIADLCAGILAVAERGQRVRPEGPEGTYFLDSGGAYGWNAIAGAACQATGRRARVLAVPQFVSAVAAAGSMLASEITRKPSILSFDKVREIRQAAWTCSSDRARREVGFAPRFPLEAGMADAVAWFRSQGLA
jgi:nucleoside-diphosphate-sugar epimerase